MYKKTFLTTNIKKKDKYSISFSFYFEDEFKDLYFVKNYEILKKKDVYINEFDEYINQNILISNLILEFIKQNLIKESNSLSLDDGIIDLSRLKANFIFREISIGKAIITNNAISIIIIILFKIIFDFYNKNRKKIFKSLMK